MASKGAAVVPNDEWKKITIPGRTRVKVEWKSEWSFSSCGMYALYPY